MADKTPMKRRVYSVRTILVCLLSGILLLALAAILIIRSYLATPRAATMVSARLSASLGVPVTLSGISLHGDTLACTDVKIANPAGFPDSALFSVRTVTVAPGWQGLLQGKRALRAVTLDGPALNVVKGRDGTWNVDPLRKRFSGGGGGAELFIGDLNISNGDILVNGRGVRGISFNLQNLATKGSADSRITFDCKDETGNRYLAEGSFKPGKDPEMELSLVAPSLKIGALANRVTMRNGPEFSEGSGHLRIHATMRKGVVRSEAEVSFGRLNARTAQGAGVPLTGSLKAAAVYDAGRDSVTLDNLTLNIEELVSLTAQGSAKNLKSSLTFDGELWLKQLDLKGLAAFLPSDGGQETVLGGRVASGRISFSGSRKEGLRELKGIAALRDFMLARGGRSLVDGVDADVTLSTSNKMIVARGAFNQEKPKGKALLEEINAPFTFAVTRKLKPHAAEFPGLAATVMGIPVKGRFSFREQDKDPLSVSIQVSEHTVQGMSAPAGSAHFVIASGTAGLLLDLQGSGASDFRGSASIGVKNLKGALRGEPFALAGSTVTADFRMGAGRFTTSGRSAFHGISYKGTTAGGRAGFRLADGLLHIENSEITVADAEIGIAELVASLPRKSSRPGQVRYPVDVRFAGGAVRRGDVSVTGIAGSAGGAYSSDGSGKKVEGALSFAAEKVLWRDQEVAAPGVRVLFSGSGGVGRVDGTALGGTMAGDFSFDPFNPAHGVSFDLSLNRAVVARLSPFIGNKGKVAPASGLLDLHTAGSYSGQNGLDCRFKGTGAGIAVSGEGGKRLIADTGLQFAGSIAQGKFVLADAILTAGEAVELRMKGEIGKIFTPVREGAVSFKLERAPLAKIVDPVASALPRFLQEGVLSGDMAAEAVLGLRDGHKRIEGFVTFDGAGVHAESQKIHLAGITGTVPVSMDMSGNGRVLSGDRHDFKREEFDQYLRKYKKTPVATNVLKIARISVGPLQFGETALHLTGANGVMEVVALYSSLNSGLFTGNAFLSVGAKGGYGAEILVNNLSLNQLCAVFPKIKGYVSGRIDGIMRLSGRKGGIDGLDGYTYFWTREGDGEKMLVSREFLQRLAGKNLQGFFFRDDRPFDRGEVRASLADGYLSFDLLDISQTNIFGIRDLSVSVAETQNRIALEHLFDSITQAASRGKGEAGPQTPAEAAPVPEFKWDQ